MLESVTCTVPEDARAIVIDGGFRVIVRFCTMIGSSIEWEREPLVASIVTV